MDGDTMGQLVARSELDKDTKVLLYDGREWQNWMGQGGLENAGAVGWESKGQGWMEARWYCWMGDVDEDGWGHAGAASREIGAG